MDEIEVIRGELLRALMGGQPPSDPTADKEAPKT